MKTIYFAAPLFNQAETRYNKELTALLEEKGHRVILPQRDGFEFQNLSMILRKHLPEKDVPNAVQGLIYLLDIGKFLPMSDAVVAVLNEPLDPGVIVEICYARLLGKQVVGLRSDTRQPFGDYSSRFGGMHFFPAFQCDYFLKVGPNDDIGAIVNFIDSCLRRITSKEQVKSKNIAGLIELAEKIFHDADDIHSDRGLEKVVRRYVQSRDEVRKVLSVVSVSLL
ncbi:nucleoside 2-deoxyribosyltransferase [Candidatus Woesearchaeota archaeon]|nr:nucleoside 2-deoxyribosyltransferase [Candidatus Woesearchaeota archaeon]